MKTPYFINQGRRTEAKRGLMLALKVLVLALVLLVSGCATTGSKHEVKFQQDAYVWVGTAPIPLSKKKGDVYRLEEQPTLVEAPGYVGVLLLPTSQEKSLINIALRPSKEWGGEEWAKTQGVLLNELVVGLNDVQSQLKKQQPRVALAKLETLQAKYPKVTYLNFLKASCLLMMGSLDDAKAVLQSALKEFPDDQSGQLVYRLMVDREKPGQGARGPASHPGTTTAIQDSAKPEITAPLKEESEVSTAPKAEGSPR